MNFRAPRLIAKRWADKNLRLSIDVGPGDHTAILNHEPRRGRLHRRRIRTLDRAQSACRGASVSRTKLSEFLLHDFALVPSVDLLASRLLGMRGERQKPVTEAV